MEAFQSSIPYDQWIQLRISDGSPPPARYKHAAEIVHDKLYVIGGSSRHGRYLSDVKVLDFKTLSWSAVNLIFDQGAHLYGSPRKLFPASSGHCVVRWGNELLIVGGYTRHPADTLTVQAIDTDTHHWSIVQTSGDIPMARGGHSATLIDSRLFIFGGEGLKGQALNDLHILDLKTMNWSKAETIQEPPLPRFDHTATAHAGRYLLIFGGGSRSTCFNDLHVLDLQTMEWSQPHIQGEFMNARAGHAGTTIDENWYVAGGGDNKRGAPDTIVVNLSKLVCSVVTHGNYQDPIASEGLTINTLLSQGVMLLVAFGGYNGKYHNEVLVLKPTLKMAPQPKIFQSPAAAAAAASVKAVYALTKKDETRDSSTVCATLKEATDKSTKQVSVEQESLSEKIKMLELALMEAKSENLKHQSELDEKNQTFDELSKEMQSVAMQLLLEKARCGKLEAQIFNLRKTLESSDALQQELHLLQDQLSKSRQDSVAGDPSIPRKRSGLLQWISGTPGNPDDAER